MKNYTLLLCIVLLFFSCEKEELTEFNSTSDTTGIDNNPTENTFSTELAFPGKTGELITFPQKDGSEIVVEKFGDTYVWMGDIILTQKQLDILRSGQKTAAVSTLSRHWPNSVVYFRIHPNLTNQARVTQAIDHWRTAAPYITFIERTNEPNYIEFVSGQGCSSQIGMTGGRQVITLANGCTRGNTIHEIGHAMGLFHEQSRTDRDNSIRVLFDNIQSNRRYQYYTYAQQGYSGFQRGAFDFGSVMIYSSFNSFAIDTSQPTMTRLDETTWVGQRNGLSAGDRNVIYFLYGVFARVEREVIESYQEYDGYAGYDVYTESAYYVRFYADRNYTTPINLPHNVTFRYKIKSRPISSYGSPPGTSTSNRTRNLTAGSNRYFLANVVEEDCSYEFGDPVGTCYDRYLEFSRGLGYQIR